MTTGAAHRFISGIGQAARSVSRGTLCFCVLTLLVGRPSVAQVDDGEDAEVRSAKNLFIYQDFERAAEALDGLLRPEIRVQDEEELRTVREYLAASYWYLQRKDMARHEFTLLLLTFPEHTLDPFQHDPEMIQFFEALRSDLTSQGVGAARSPDITPPVVLPAIDRVVRRNPYITNFIPFGVGQFQNDDTTWGVVYLVTEAIALSATVATYFLIQDTRRDDPERARQYRTAFWASQGTFWGLAVTGIVHAMIQWEPEFVEEPSVETEPGPQARSSSDSSLFPSITVLPEGGAHFGVGGRF